MSAPLVSDLQTEIINEIGLSSAAEGGLVLGWLLSGWRIMNDKLRFYVGTTTIALTAGTGDYDLATTVEWIEELTIDGSFVKAERVPLEVILDRRRYNNTAVSQTDVYQYSIDGQKLSVWPSPTSNGTATIYYGTDPFPTLTAFAGTENIVSALFFSPLGELYECLRLYGLFRAAAYDDKVLSERAQDYLAQFQAQLVQCKKAIRRRAGKHLPGAQVGYPVKRGWPSRNDVYPSTNQLR